MLFLLHSLKSYNRLLKRENFFKIFNILTSPLCVLSYIQLEILLTDEKKNSLNNEQHKKHAHSLNSHFQNVKLLFLL